MNKDQVKGYIIKLLRDENKNKKEIKELVEKLDILMDKIKKEQAAGYYYEIDEWNI